MIKKIAIDGLLSFEKFELELRNLNVLIGANGSGKSNLIEVLSLLQALATTEDALLGRWSLLRHGRSHEKPATVEVELGGSASNELPQSKYRLSMAMHLSRLSIFNEELAVREQEGTWRPVGESAILGPSPISVLNPTHTVGFAHHDDPSLASIALPELAQAFRSFRLYRDWSFGAGAAPRQFQDSAREMGYLRNDAANLALVVTNMLSAEEVEREFRSFYPRFRRFGVTVLENSIMLKMWEEGVEDYVPASRWSDGMIRYLSLLAILCHPNPPPLICIDEPELGFHPDIMPDLGRLIKSCAERTQIIITTHSRDLVDEFSDDPEAVVVCERDFDGATRMTRQEKARLDEWLERYTLGKLWEKGEIGGNRY